MYDNTFNRMKSRDRLRKQKGLPPSTQKDLLRFANEVGIKVLEFESEMRAASQLPPLQSTDTRSNNPSLPKPEQEHVHLHLPLGTHANANTPGSAGEITFPRGN